MPYKKTGIVLGLLTAMIVFMQCLNKKQVVSDPRGSLYAGSASCIECHQPLSDVYQHSRHYATSAISDYTRLSKLINAQNSKVAFRDMQEIAMEAKDSVMLQSYWRKGIHLRSEKMDITLGSGEKAFTFLYWREKELLQLPLSYLTSKQIWTNSPGFPVDQPYFDRPLFGMSFILRK